MNKSAALLSLAVTVLVSSESAFAAAYYFESTTSTRGSGKDNSVTVHAWIDGMNGKIEIVEGSQGFLAKGGYLLTTTGAQTIYLVDPDKMTYSEMNLERLLGTLSNVMSGMPMKIEFSDISQEKLGEGPSEPILGYPTTRYEYRSQYTMTISAAIFSRKSRVETHSEYWCTDAVGGEAFKMWLGPEQLRTGNAELDKFMSMDIDPGCLALRTRIETREDGETSTTTAEVTRLDVLDAIPAETFELPSNYEAVDLMSSLPDDLTLPGGEADGDATKPEPQDPPRRPRLRDLLLR